MSAADESRRPVEFWFDFSSPYGYFAAHEIDTRMERCGRAVLWRPFMLGAVFKLTGMAPLVAMPLRGDYARRDCDRIARKLGVPFCILESHPYPSQMVARAFSTGWRSISPMPRSRSPMPPSRSISCTRKPW